MLVRAARTSFMLGASSRVSRYKAAYPAASSHALRSRSGTSRDSASITTISRLGFERPVSTKLRCRLETPASSARCSWLLPRDKRRDRMICPILSEELSVEVAMLANVRHRGRQRHYLGGNRREGRALLPPR